MDAWDEEAVRSRCKKSVETCERFLAERRRPDAPPGEALYDLCLAEYAVQKHLLAAGCFSSRKALVAELTRLLNEPVDLPLLPCLAERYLVCQKMHIEMEISNLTQPPKKKSWFEKS